MPDWVVSVLIRYPIVVAIGFVAWYAYRELRTANANHVQRERELHAAALADLTEANAQAVTAVRDELDK